MDGFLFAVGKARSTQHAYRKHHYIHWKIKVTMFNNNINLFLIHFGLWDFGFGWR